MIFLSSIPLLYRANIDLVNGYLHYYDRLCQIREKNPCQISRCFINQHIKWKS